MKIEMHLHTAQSSVCGKVSAEDALREYARRGYDGVVITDHFSRSNFAKYSFGSPKEKTDVFLKGYRAAKKAGEALGLKVFLGAEMRFEANNSNDYLFYGADEEFFYEHPDLDELSFSDFLKLKPENSLVYQAHPFRNGITVTDPKKLFGVEVFNGHAGHDSRNLIALAWARLHKLHAISGSDAHYSHALCTGGILADREVDTMEELIEVLREDAYALITKNALDPRFWG